MEINRNPEPAVIRRFAGLWLPLGCAAAGAVLYWRADLPAAAAAVWAAGAVGALAGLAFPAAGKALFLGLSYATFPIGWLASHLILLAAYVLLFTPVGLLMRLAGRDPLARRFDPRAPTYWLPHQQAEKKERYFQQF